MISRAYFKDAFIICGSDCGAEGAMADDEKAIRRIKAPLIGGGPPRGSLPGIPKRFELTTALRIYADAVQKEYTLSAGWYERYG